MRHTRVNEQHLLHKEWDCCDITSAGGHYGVQVSTTSVQIPWCTRRNIAYIFEANGRFLCNRMELKGLFTRKKIMIQTTFCGKVGLGLFLLCLSQVPNPTSPQRQVCSHRFERNIPRKSHPHNWRSKRNLLWLILWRKSLRTKLTLNSYMLFSKISINILILTEPSWDLERSLLLF